MTWLLAALLLAGVAALAYRLSLGAPSAPPAGVTVPLFAGDVPLTSLPLSLSVETMGGVSTVLIPRGTALPAALSETFSTASDSQAQIEVHVRDRGDPACASGRADVRGHLRDRCAGRVHLQRDRSRHGQEPTRLGAELTSQSALSSGDHQHARRSEGGTP